jgi:hypothetical protein
MEQSPYIATPRVIYKHPRIALLPQPAISIKQFELDVLQMLIFYYCPVKFSI